MVVTNVQRRVQINGELSKYVTPEGNHFHNARSFRVGVRSTPPAKKANCFRPSGETVCASNNGIGVSR
jgi:hypothetical protein